MFWGLILKPNKKYSQTVTKAFHLSQAALDTSTAGDEDVQVMLTSDNNVFLLCTLRKNKTLQCPLDLNFAEGDSICFTIKGNGIVHLTGFLIPDAEDEFADLEDASDEEEEVSADKQLAAAGKKDKKAEKLAKLAAAVQPEAKKAKAAATANAEEEESDSDEEMDAEDADSDNEAANEAAAGSDSDEEEDDSDEDEDDSDEEEEETEAQPPKKMKQQNGLENGKPAGKEQKKDKQQQQQQPKGGQKTLVGGVVIEDIKPGTGVEAKSGKKVQVYYEGRLKQNNKVFDSAKQGAGFKFFLGRGEVIKGWDVGVQGMKVGGKRRIVCPPNMAYGTKGSPPVIPPNSTLVFEVELKNVH